MALVTDYEKIQAGQRIIGWKANVLGSISQIDGTLGNLVNLKTQYPDDVVEIDGYISQLKTALQNLINKY